MAKLFYRKYRNNNAQNKGFGKWYGRAVITETVGIEEIAQELQANCTVKRADVLAVLSELGPVIGTLLTNSKRVHIPYVGFFKLGLKSKGADTFDDFNVREHVAGVKILFQPETRTTESGKRVKKMIEGVSITELPDRMYDNIEDPDDEGGEDPRP